MQPRDILAQKSLSGAEADSYLAQLQSVALTGGDITRARLLARAELVSRRHTARLRYVVAYQAPDNLRIETLPLNSALALSVLVCRSGELTLLDSNERQAILGRCNQDVLQSLIGVPLEPRQLISILLGRLDISNWRQPQVLLTEQGTHVFDALSYLSLSEGRLQVLELSQDPRRRNPMRVEYRYGALTQGPSIPEQIRLSLPKYKTEIHMTLSHVNLTPSDKPELFELAVPDGYDVETVGSPQ